MQNDNSLNTEPQNAPQTNAQPPSLVSRGEKIIQPLHSNVTPETTPTSQHAINPVPTNTSTITRDPYPTSTDISTPVDSDSSYSSTYLTGSKIAPEKKPLHFGIYIIAAWNMVGFALSFFSTSQTNAIYTLIMALDLLVGVGLLFRLEMARKVMVWLAGILLVLSAISLILAAGLQQRIAQNETNFNNAVSHINQQQLTQEQQQQLASMKTTLNNEKKEAGKAINVTYFKLGASTIEGLVVLIYLTRPKIKEVFVELPTQ